MPGDRTDTSETSLHSRTQQANAQIDIEPISAQALNSEVVGRTYSSSMGKYDHSADVALESRDVRGVHEKKLVGEDALQSQAAVVAEQSVGDGSNVPSRKEKKCSHKERRRARERKEKERERRRARGRERYINPNSCMRFCGCTHSTNADRNLFNYYTYLHDPSVHGFLYPHHCLSRRSKSSNCQRTCSSKASRNAQQNLSNLLTMAFDEDRLSPVVDFKRADEPRETEEKIQKTKKLPSETDRGSSPLDNESHYPFSYWLDP